MSFDLIRIHKDIAAGAPTLKGRRLNMYDIISSVEMKPSLTGYLKDFELSREEVRQAVNYCSQLRCIKEKPYHYCAGCTLRSVQLEPSIALPEQIRRENNQLIFSYQTHESSYHFIEEEEEEIGRNGWEIARLQKLRYFKED